MLTKIYQKIKEYSTIIIYRHARPDGDALGAQLGLKTLLKDTYPHKHIYAVGDMTERLSWIGKMDEISDDIYKNALIIVLDTGADYLISDEKWKLGHEVIKIDHHFPQGEYGDYSYIDTQSESTCSIVATLAIQKRYKMSKEAATYLFIGIVTDSGRFRYSSTSDKTLKIAAELLKYNVDTESIYSKIYVEKLKLVKLKAKLIDKFVVDLPGLAYLINTKEEIKELNIDINDISRGMINIMSGIEEITVWANFCEDESGCVFCELRGRDKNVYKIATKYGGGGHVQASGMTLKSQELIPAVIKDLQELAREE